MQFLPVQWRANLDLDSETDERLKDAALDNNFTLSGMPRDGLAAEKLNYVMPDITIKNSVPYVRDLMNNVLIDIPYFMRYGQYFCGFFDL